MDDLNPNPNTLTNGRQTLDPSTPSYPLVPVLDFHPPPHTVLYPRHQPLPLQPPPRHPLHQVRPDSHLHNYTCENTGTPSSSTRALLQAQALPKPTAMASTSSGKHPRYRGIRCRGGKWVSEIREPRKTKRIWLGTFPTPEMAAAAYDVAALALKGIDVALNFPSFISSYPVPESPSALDIRSAATRAAEALRKNEETESLEPDHRHDDAMMSTSFVCSVGDYMDEEELFGMPNLLVNMAEGMLISPPRMNDSPSSDSDSPGKSDGGESRLWSYY